MKHVASLAAVLLAGSVVLAVRGEGREDADARFFRERVWPILKDHCLRCHGGERTRNNLDVSSRDGLLRGGDHGPALMPGMPERSMLIRAVRDEGEYQMPPKEKLGAREVADLVDWVRRGAPWPAR
jgi:hypothetical protein